MRLRLRSFLLTSALTFAPALASATTISGLYVDGGAGYNNVQDQHVHANSPTDGNALPKFTVNHGTGYTGFGAIGWGFGNGLRVEAEGLYNFSHDSYTSYKRDTDIDPNTSNADVSSGENPFFAIDRRGPNIKNEHSGGSLNTQYSAPYVIQNGPFAGKCLISGYTGVVNGPVPSYPSPTFQYDHHDWMPSAQCRDLINIIPAPGASPVGYQPLYVYSDGQVGLLSPLTSQVALNHHGSDESFGGFANVLYDFDLERLFGMKSIVTPFVGGGAGYLWQRYNRPNTMMAAITGTHGGFSWQGIAGVAFDTGISGLQVTAQYRMIGQPGSFYNGAFNYGTDGGHANFDQRFNHQFIVGFRYAFHNQPVPIQAPPVPRPIVAAAPAPVPARSYLVFFDWNQYALTSRARQIVVEAAHATSYVHTTRINVNGYTDSSAAPGPAGQKYNYALSVKRAKSVEAELIRNGVPASEIVIRGYGDTNPLVPTAPNTREPQNRRVEIILHA